MSSRSWLIERGAAQIAGVRLATPLCTYIPRAIFDCCHQFSQVQLTLREMNAMQRIGALIAGELYVGLVPGRALPAANVTQTAQ